MSGSPSGVLDDKTPRFTIRDTGTIIGLVAVGAIGWTNVQAEIDALREAQARQEKRLVAMEAVKMQNAITLAKICVAVKCEQQGIEQ